MAEEPAIGTQPMLDDLEREVENLTTPAPSMPAPTTPAPSMPAPTTPAPSMPAPTTPAPSMPAPVTPAAPYGYTKAGKPRKRPALTGDRLAAAQRRAAHARECRVKRKAELAAARVPAPTPDPVQSAPNAETAENAVGKFPSRKPHRKRYSRDETPPMSARDYRRLMRELAKLEALREALSDSSSSEESDSDGA